MGLVAMFLFATRRTPYGDAVGAIQLGNFTEEFHVSTLYWAPKQYEEQWTVALQELASGAPKGCLIASLDDPGVPGSKAFLWVYYRDGSDVVFQNLFLQLDDCRPRFLPANANEWIPDRHTVSEDGDPISEWRVPFAALKTAVRVQE